MPYIIDGNNLIGCSPDISLADSDARNKLVYLLSKFQQNKKSSVLVVFDGEPDLGLVMANPGKNKFSVHFPNYGSSADDKIKSIISGYTHCKDVTLVTSDKELKMFAKNKGAKTVNSIEFYFDLKRAYRITGKQEEKQKRENVSLSESEVDQWLKIFKK